LSLAFSRFGGTQDPLAVVSARVAMG